MGLKPIAYTEYEGGEWLPWRGGYINDDLKYKGCKLTDWKVVIQGVRLHSLAFTDPSKKDFKRWDAIKLMN
jgi:hypothetical protein